MTLGSNDSGTRSDRRAGAAVRRALSDPVPVDEQVAAAWALLRRRLKAAGKKMKINDSWIAATALTHRWPVVTQDDGFPDDIGDLTVIRV